MPEGSWVPMKLSNWRQARIQSVTALTRLSNKNKNPYCPIKRLGTKNEAYLELSKFYGREFPISGI